MRIRFVLFFPLVLLFFSCGWDITATVTTINKSQYDATDIHIFIGSETVIAELKQNEAKTVKISAHESFGGGYVVKYRINGKSYDIENDADAKPSEDGTYCYSDKCVINGSEVVITIYDERYEITVN